MSIFALKFDCNSRSASIRVMTSEPIHFLHPDFVLSFSLLYHVCGPLLPVGIDVRQEWTKPIFGHSAHGSYARRPLLTRPLITDTVAGKAQTRLDPVSCLQRCRLGKIRLVDHHE